MLHSGRANPYTYAASRFSVPALLRASLIASNSVPTGKRVGGCTGGDFNVHGTMAGVGSRKEKRAEVSRFGWRNSPSRYDSAAAAAITRPPTLVSDGGYAGDGKIKDECPR